MIFDIEKVKLIVAIPTGYTEIIRDAVCKAGAGNIGEYSYCTSSMKSYGTFLPGENSNPFIGKSNELELVKGEIFEVVCDIYHVEEVLKALKEAHPYEEPAVDIVPLIDEKAFCKIKKKK